MLHKLRLVVAIGKLKGGCMIGLLKLLFSYQFLVGVIVGAGGIVIYLTIIGNKLFWNKVK